MDDEDDMREDGWRKKLLRSKTDFVVVLLTMCVLLIITIIQSEFLSEKAEAITVEAASLYTEALLHEVHTKVGMEV